MIKILFICHGNICRSPMAEFVMKDLVKKARLEHKFQIASAAVSREELGNPVYPPARRELAAHGLGCKGHAARQITRRDYDEWDYLICMERYNLRNMKRIIPFVNQLKKKLPQIPIEMVDERFTSVLAHQAMIDGGLKKKDRQRKELVDEISATIILQSYLESRNHKW